MPPRVSVLMAVHNGWPYLGHAVQGMLDQTFRDFEFVIVDDGSTDETASFIGSINDQRVRVIRTERMGLTRALNVGLAACQGEFVARQDADDVSLPERLERQVRYLEHHADVGLVGTGVDLIDEAGHPMWKRLFPASDDELRERLYAFDNPFCHTTIVVRRKSLESVGRYREWFRRSQDYDLYLRLIEEYRIATIPEVLCLLRYRLSSASLEDGELGQLKFALMAYLLADVRRHCGIDLMTHPRWFQVAEEYEGWFATTRLRRQLISMGLRRRARIEFVGHKSAKALRAVVRATLYDPWWPLVWIGVVTQGRRLGAARRWMRETALRG